MGTYVVTGASSGIGAATRAQLETEGHRVMGVDLAGSEIAADLATAAGRRAAIQAVVAKAETSDGVIDGIVTCAGIAGLPGRDGGLMTALNYFGSVALIDGVRPALARSSHGAAVAIASNSATTVPLVSHELVAACLADDEPSAIAIGTEVGPFSAYPSSKAAICQWVRRHAVTEDWSGAGISLNAIAPGVTETPMVAETRADPVIGKYVDDFPVPVGRGADPAEIAAAICFLLSPQARFFCGSIVFCDGGTDALTRPTDY